MYCFFGCGAKVKWDGNGFLSTKVILFAATMGNKAFKKPI